MLDWTATTLLAYLEANWGWAAGLAVSMMGLTALAGLLNRQRKDEVALWLMGAHTEEGWARSFTTLFDAVFGRRHLSPRCFLRSALASLVAVVVIWLLMGSAETIGLRLQSDLTLGCVLVLGLAINVVADYVSLLETRLLLAHMPRPWLAQAGVLILDLLLSAAIIWLAIFAYIRSPLHQGEIESFAEILGVFSIFSVFFYSTFLTSVWTWAYIASTWLMRLAKRLRLADWLDVEHRPILILSNALGLVTFLGALGLSGPLTRDEQGLTAADRALCGLFRGPVCEDVAAFTAADQTRMELITLACARDETGECVIRSLETFQIDRLAAHAFWAHSCLSGSAPACTNLGFLSASGWMGTADFMRAGELLDRGCVGGDLRGCASLRQMCLAGAGGICDSLGDLHANTNRERAAQLYLWSCQGEDWRGCEALAVLLGTDFGHSQFVKDVLSLGPAVGRFEEMCIRRFKTDICVLLGRFYHQGIGLRRDLQKAARFYREACGRGDSRGCSYSGVYVKTDPPSDPICYLDMSGCSALLGMLVERCLHQPSPATCTELGLLQEQGLLQPGGVNTDEVDDPVGYFYRLGCKGGHKPGCVRLCERGDDDACARANQLGVGELGAIATDTEESPRYELGPLLPPLIE